MPLAGGPSSCQKNQCSLCFFTEGTDVFGLLLGPLKSENRIARALIEQNQMLFDWRPTRGISSAIERRYERDLWACTRQCVEALKSDSGNLVFGATICRNERLPLDVLNNLNHRLCTFYLVNAIATEPPKQFATAASGKAHQSS